MNRAFRPLGAALIAGGVLMLFAGIAFPARTLPSRIVLSPASPATPDELAAAAREIDGRLAALGFDQAEARVSRGTVVVQIGADFAGTVRQMLADLSGAGKLPLPADVSAVQPQAAAGSRGTRFLFFGLAALFAAAGAWIVRAAGKTPPRRVSNPNGAGRLSSNGP